MSVTIGFAIRWLGLMRGGTALWGGNVKMWISLKKSYLPIPWRDSISRPIAPVSSVECGDDTTRPRRHGNDRIWNFTQLFNVMCTATAALKKIETILSELITQTMQ
jgi:hypothetical protein